MRVACPRARHLLASKRLTPTCRCSSGRWNWPAFRLRPYSWNFLAKWPSAVQTPRRFRALRHKFPQPAVALAACGGRTIPGDLRVRAGDIEGDSVTSWFKTCLPTPSTGPQRPGGQTRSMYGGAPRKTGSRLVLDQRGKVSHFNYFSNERTAEAIVNAITQDTPAGFRVIGPLSWAGESSTGARGRKRGADDGKPPADKPAVFVLPGNLGSNLKVKGKRIWLGWRLINGLKQLDYTGRPDGVEPDGPIGMSYDDLGEYLAKTHEVIEFAFDWRRPIEEEARRLADGEPRSTRCGERDSVRFSLIDGGVLARTSSSKTESLARLRRTQGAGDAWHA